MGNSLSKIEGEEDNFNTDCDIHIGRVIILEDVQLSSRQSDENIIINGKVPVHKHHKQTTSISKSEARRVLRDLHKKFQDNLHIDEIVPVLYRENLLTEDEKESIAHPHLTRSEKVDRLLRYLPMKGKNMMHILVRCLESTDDGTGHAHIELAGDLEEKLGKKLRFKSLSPKRQSAKTYHPYARKPITEYLKPKQNVKTTPTLYDTKPIETFIEPQSEE